MKVKDVTSVDIATYRDERLDTINKRTGKPLSSSTVRLEMSLLSNFFNLSRIEWGSNSFPNPCFTYKKPKIPLVRVCRLKTREEELTLSNAHAHKRRKLYQYAVMMQNKQSQQDHH